MKGERWTHIVEEPTGEEFADAIDEWLRDGYEVHLETFRVYRDGVQVWFCIIVSKRPNDLDEYEPDTQPRVFTGR